MANQFLCCGGILEFGWSGFVWILDQRTNCAVLHAGTKYDSSARAYGSLRSVWNARYWTYVVLPKGTWNKKRLEDRCCGICLLGDQHWSGAHGPYQSLACWTDANVGQR